MSTPRFKYSVSNPNDKNYGYITAGNNKIHRIANVDEFYKALGYTDEVRSTGLMADEFLWFEYRKDGCTKSEMCQQAKIVEYLSKHSASFMEKYASQFNKWLGSCSEDRAREAADCGDCLLHPVQKTIAATPAS